MREPATLFFLPQSASRQRYSTNLTKSLGAAYYFLRVPSLKFTLLVGVIMNDLLFITLTVAFFGAAILYLRGCAKLR